MAARSTAAGLLLAAATLSAVAGPVDTTAPAPAPAPTIGSRIGFQAHSYNDMRSWEQLFLKGATHIKIDPNFRPRSFCAKQPRVRNASDHRGCFVRLALAVSMPGLRT